MKFLIKKDTSYIYSKIGLRYDTLIFMYICNLELEATIDSVTMISTRLLWNLN